MINELDPKQQQRREALTDTWARFALDGLLPTDDDIRYARAYVTGGTTLEAIIAVTICELRRT